MKAKLKIADSMLDLIGDIPLVRLNRIGKETGAEILVKPEFLNPSGSIKDRIAKTMIEDAEKEGLLEKGSTIIEATTGNTGTALAFVAAVKGYDFVSYVPGRVANKSRMAIMLAYGGAMETVDSGEITKDTSEHGGHVEPAGRQICLEVERTRKNVWWARQFSHPQNTAAHRDWTVKEIIEMTDGILDGFVASVGTGGTLLGAGQALKKHDPKIAIWGVEPAGRPMMANPDDYPIIPGVTDGIHPEIFKSGLVDKYIAVSDAEAIDMTHQLAEKEGLFCGMSSGANVIGCLRLAAELGAGKRVVTVLPDSRDRYLEVEKYTT